MCSMIFNLDPSYHSERKKPRKQKEPYAQSLTPFCTYFRLELDLLHLVSFPLIFHYLSARISILNLNPHPNFIPKTSVWVCNPALPAPSCFLAVPKLEFEARHLPRNGDLCSHRDNLEQVFLHHPLPGHRSSIPPRHDASC